MKQSFILLLLLFTISQLIAQTPKAMKQKNISTKLGVIATYQKVVPNTIPVVFLHGVYYDHKLWNYYTQRITDRTVVTIDMPFHGKSKAISNFHWKMADCAEMLLTIIATLEVEKVYAIGHSWGSMTILRAAAKSPHKFKAIGLCNMPLKKGSFGKKLKFGLQHSMLSFRNFYTKQLGKAMFSKENRKNKPELMQYLTTTLTLLSKKEIRRTDRAVITQVTDGHPYLDSLVVPALALKGAKDYVQTPRTIETKIVKGAHTSPLEQPKEVLIFIKKVFEK